MPFVFVTLNGGSGKHASDEVKKCVTEYNNKQEEKTELPLPTCRTASLVLG